MSYTITDLGVLTGHDESEAWGINASGQISGGDRDGGDRAIIWDGGPITLGALGGIGSSALRINASGQISGTAEVSAGVYHAYRWGGTMTDLGTLAGDTLSIGKGINASGEVVGNSGSRPCRWPAANAIELGALSGQTIGAANAINTAGMIAGMAVVADAVHVVTWESDVATDRGLMGGLNAHANDINDSEQVVGGREEAGTREAFLWSTGSGLTVIAGAQEAWAVNADGHVVGFMDSGGDQHAFLWDGATLTDLNDELPGGSGWVVQASLDINDDGDIVGYGLHNGNKRAFLMTPPTTTQPPA